MARSDNSASHVRPARSRFIAECAMALLLLLPVSAALAATTFPPHGGSGGSGFHEECPTGEYLVGASYKAGSWLDQIAILCAPIDPSGLTGPQSQGSAVGGSGGVAGKKFCNAGHVVTGGGILLRPDGKFVKMLDLHCKATTSNAGYLLANVGSAASVFPEVFQQCPTGEAVIGIDGRSGNFVDAISLICDSISPFNPAEPEPVAEACIGIEGDEVPAQWQSMLDVHNERRTQHCVAPLTWNTKLARDAQDYAEQCILNMHGSDGENMADAWSIVNGNPVLPAMSDRDAFEKTWYCEVDNYDFQNPQFNGGFTVNCRDVNGHFTQVVWRETCQLGCGRATCEMTDENGNVRTGTHWVCRYNPPGNVNAGDQAVLMDQVKPPLCVGKGG